MAHKLPFHQVFGKVATFLLDPLFCSRKDPAENDDETTKPDIFIPGFVLVPGN
jgi:hypothetical protein